MSSDLKRFLGRLMDTNPATRITVDEILKDPWFRKGGYKEIKFYDEDCSMDNSKIGGGDEDQKVVTSLNAFDLISFSAGLDLSGLFDDHSYGERFVLEETVEKVVERAEAFAKAEELRVRRKKKWGLEMEGQNGNLAIGVEVYRLTENLVVVEARRTGGDAGPYREMWKNKLRPHLMCPDDHEISPPLPTPSSSSAASSSSSLAQTID